MQNWFLDVTPQVSPELARRNLFWKEGRRGGGGVIVVGHVWEMPRRYDKLGNKPLLEGGGDFIKEQVWLGFGKGATMNSYPPPVPYIPHLPCSDLRA